MLYASVEGQEEIVTHQLFACLVLARRRARQFLCYRDEQGMLFSFGQWHLKCSPWTSIRGIVTLELVRM